MRDSTNAPVTLGVPLLITGLAADATSRTYRYYFKDRNTANTVDLFGTGTIIVNFLDWGTSTTTDAGRPAWNTVGHADAVGDSLVTDGWNVKGLSQSFTLARPPTGPARPPGRAASAR